MNTTTLGRNKFLPLIESRKNRKLFIVINIYLIIGVCSLLVTIFYLLGHLDVADSIIKYCYPGFALGLSSGIIYFVGYQSMMKEKKRKGTYTQTNFVILSRNI